MLTKWFASDVDSLSLNFHWNSLKFVERFCTKLSQKTWLPQVLCQMGAKNAHWCSQNTKKGVGFDFLQCYHDEGDEFLDKTVTGDETCIKFVNVETKERSRQWMHTHSLNKPRKFKQSLANGKLMATVFWDRKGVLLIEFMEPGTTITSETYCETLKKLRRAIENKRRGMLMSGVVLLHDNARPHTAACTHTSPAP